MELAHTQPQEVRFESASCNLLLQRFPPQIVVLKITGQDVGEFGPAPMRALSDWVEDSGWIELFIDARNVRGASMDVSSEWAGWLSAHRSELSRVTMLTGSRFIHITAEFVRRFASLEGLMRICSEPEVFDFALAEALAK